MDFNIMDALKTGQNHFRLTGKDRSKNAWGITLIRFSVFENAIRCPPLFTARRLVHNARKITHHEAITHCIPHQNIYCIPHLKSNLLEQ